jgi:hypothetical protein
VTASPVSRSRPIRGLYEYAALWLGLGLLGIMSLIWCLFAVPLYYALPARRAQLLGRSAIATGFRIYLGALLRIGACRFGIACLDALRTEGPPVIATNHPCLLDARLIVSRLPRFACIMKAGIVDNL